MTVEPDEPELELPTGPRVHPLLHYTAPLVTAGAIWAARQAINITYQRTVQRSIPVPSDPRTSWTRAIGWAALTASTAAVIEVAVHRLANERLPRRRPPAAV
jgi:Protein of unknown function (DUF4235)